MRIKKLLTLTTTEQQQIKDFGNFIKEICDEIGRSNCNHACLFSEFCNFEKDVSRYFSDMLKEEFNCNVNMEFED